MKKHLALFGGPKVRKKPFAPHPILGKEETKEVMSVLKSGQLSGFVAKPGDHFNGGPQVKRLESAFSRYFDAPYAVAMNSATSALHAALYAVGVEPGDEVIVPSYTMSASASAILMCGALPVFADIGDDFCLDPNEVTKKITPKTRAILVVHLFGHPARIRDIMAIAKKHKLVVVEDCAQSPGAWDGKQYVGTFGDVGVFSLNQHKTITTGEGGVAIASDKRTALRMQLIRNHGEVVHDHLPEAREEYILGWNYRMTELEASVGIAQFAKMEKLTRHRIHLAEVLAKKLSKQGFFSLPETRQGCRHVYFLFPLLYDESKTGVPRARIAQALSAEGVPFGEGYVRPIYWEPIYQKKRIFQKSNYPFNLGQNLERHYRKGSCLRTEFFHEKSLLATGLCRYPLSARDMEDVAKAILKICNNIDEFSSKP